MAGLADPTFTGTVTAPTLTSTTATVSGTLTAGKVKGDVYAGNGTSKVLENGTDGTDAAFTGAVTGNVTGNLTGNVTGNLTGKATKIAGGAAMSVPYQSAVDTTAFLAAGTAGQLLQTNGTGSAPTWVDRTQGWPKVLVKTAASTSFFGPDVTGIVATGTVVTQNRVYFTPFINTSASQIDALAVRYVAGAASSSVNVGIYNSDTATGLPTTLVKTVNIPTIASANVLASTAFTAIDLPAGFYWLGVVCGQATSATFHTTALSTTSGGMWYMPTSAFIATMPTPDLYDLTAATAGALPTTTSGSFGIPSNRSPIVMARRV